MFNVSPSKLNLAAAATLLCCWWRVLLQRPAIVCIVVLHAVVMRKHCRLMSGRRNAHVVALYHYSNTTIFLTPSISMPRQQMAGFNIKSVVMCSYTWIHWEYLGSDLRGRVRGAELPSGGREFKQWQCYLLELSVSSVEEVMVGISIKKASDYGQDSITFLG